MSPDEELFSRRMAGLPKVSLGFYPTPLCKLERLSADYGVNIFIKREDLSGISAFGGNKMRKLEYVFGDVLRTGCDVVFTYGATQSNHAMQTATAARKCGVEPILWLTEFVRPNENDVRANLLLDAILGAEVHVISWQEAQDHEGTTRERRRELEMQGHKVYDILGGAANALGGCGFAEGFLELHGQMAAIGKTPDFIFTTTGSGGTLSGLVAAKKALGLDTEIVGIRVADKPASYKDDILRLSNDVLEFLGYERLARDDDFEVNSDYYGEGYEIPYEPANDTIRLVARTEGIMLDPVYTGKGFNGMLEYIKNGAVPRGSNVVFLHTGGTTALFSEPSIVGTLPQNDNFFALDPEKEHERPSPSI